MHTCATMCVCVSAHYIYVYINTVWIHYESIYQTNIILHIHHVWYTMKSRAILHSPSHHPASVHPRWTISEEPWWLSINPPWNEEWNRHPKYLGLRQRHELKQQPAIVWGELYAKQYSWIISIFDREYQLDIAKSYNTTVYLHVYAV